VGSDPYLKLRHALPSDAAAIAELLAQLGYPGAETEVRDRLGRLTGRAAAGALVAEVEGKVAGVAAYQIIDVLERDRPQCRITTLVVDHRHRRRGLAGALVEAIEVLARQHRCFRLEVTTRPERVEADAFYLALGFNERPRRLIKPLPEV
jgi:N-acetylglutamate synthase-like GNAT family acetyltransferase